MLAKVRGGATILKYTTFQIFPKNQFFSQIQNSPNYPGAGQENYGLFPQFVTFFVWIASLIF